MWGPYHLSGSIRRAHAPRSTGTIHREVTFQRVHVGWDGHLVLGHGSPWRGWIRFGITGSREPHLIRCMWGMYLILGYLQFCPSKIPINCVASACIVIYYLRRVSIHIGIMVYIYIYIYILIEENGGRELPMWQTLFEHDYKSF